MRQQLFLLFLPHAALCATAGAGGGFIVPYPFGFSGDCPILLGCNAIASTPLLPRSTAVAPYPVLPFNSASSTFVVSLALSCNRTVGDAAASLSGASYSVSSRTTVFLRGGCRDPPPSNCTAALPASFIAQAAQCGSGAASDTVWTCVSSERPPAGSTEEARGQGQFLNWTSVQEAGCEDAVTASVFEAAVPGIVPGLELGVAELGWWLDGACTHATGGGKCAQNATCHDVQTPSGAWGHRCACLVDGMSGDGFTGGEGCHDHDSAVRETNRLLMKMLHPIIACVLLVTFGTLVWTCKSRGNRQKKKVQKRMMLDYLSSMDEAGGKNIEFPLISFENIVAATDNFSNCNMLGQGGFGKVYKGMLEGTKEVAVKRLSKGSGHGTEEFRNEVVLIAKLQHKNLVKLIGCCIHEDEKLLVYEYLPNKSLDYFLFDGARKSVLQWPTRFKVIQGVARGIMYLHQDSRLTIIHRDLKASNILLDKEMSPKISDFGMARIFCGDQLQANTNRVVGTYGYMSPEYAMEGAFSVKSDTYSFGVLTLEIVSGLKISSPYLIKDFPNLIAYAWNYWKDGKIEDLVDSSMVEDCSLDEVSRCIHVALLCVQDSPNSRQLMSAVVFMLENKTTPLPTPKQPVYFVRDYEPRKASDNMASSINDASLTTLQGR